MASLSEKSKTGINRKVAIGVVSLIFTLVTTAICSFFPFIINPSLWMTTDFLTKEMIIIAISMLAMIGMTFIAMARNDEDARSDIAMARAEFQRTIKLIDNKNIFSLWVKQVLQPEDIIQAKKDALAEVGVFDYELMEFSTTELKSMMESQVEIRGKVRQELTKAQYDMIMKVKGNYPKFNLVGAEYYLVCTSIGANKTLSERSGNEGKTKVAIMSFTVISKILTTLIPAMILTSLVYDAASGKEQAQAWLDFFSRMTAFGTGCFSGYLMGTKFNNVDASYISLRSLAHEKYSQDHRWEVGKDGATLVRKGSSSFQKQDNAIIMNTDNR